MPSADKDAVKKTKKPAAAKAGSAATAVKAPAKKAVAPTAEKAVKPAVKKAPAKAPAKATDKVTDKKVATPKAAAPKVAKPKAAAPKAAVPKAAAPKEAKPAKAVKPAKASKAAAPKAAAPKAAAPKAAAPKAAAPKAAKSKAAGVIETLKKGADKAKAVATKAKGKVASSKKAVELKVLSRLNIPNLLDLSKQSMDSIKAVYTTEVLPKVAKWAGVETKLVRAAVGIKDAALASDAVLNVKQMMRLSQFVALIESLKAKVGESAAVQWLTSKAAELNNKVPAALMKTEAGLQQVIAAVKAIRTKPAKKAK